MLTIERRIGKLLRYGTVFLANADDVRSLGEKVGFTQVIQVLDVPESIGECPGLVKCQPELTTAIDLTKDLDAIFGAIQQRVRRYIRAAIKLKPMVTANDDRARRDMVALYNDFAGEHGHSAPISLTSLERVSSFTDCIVVYDPDGQPAAGHVTLKDAATRRARGFQYATARLRRDPGLVRTLHRYLHWYEFERFKSEGFQQYDFGGIRYPEHPVAQFKLGFGGGVSRTYIYVLAGLPLVGRVALAIYIRFARNAGPLRDPLAIKARNSAVPG